MRALLLSSFLVPALLSAPALPADGLSLDQALAQAAQHNPTLRQAQAALAQARERKLAAWSAFLPKLSLSAGQSEGGAYDPTGGTFGGASTGTSLGLSSSINLFRGLGDLAALRQAEATLGSAEEDLRVSVAQVSYDVRAAWAQLLFSQEQVTLNSQTTKRREDNAAMVELRFKVGSENKGSLLQTQAQSVQSEADDRSAIRSLAGAQRALARLLGQDKPGELKADGDFPVPTEPTVDDAAKLAETLPTVTKARLALTAAKAAKFGSNAAFLPSLNASAGVNRNGADWLPENGSWSAGLSLSWNLFNGFSDLANRNSATETLISQEAALEDALRQGADDLDDARDGLANGLDQLKVRQAVLEANEVRADIARAQYTQGLIGFQDWDQIESALISAQQSSLNGHLSAALSSFAWQKALSKGWEP